MNVTNASALVSPVVPAHPQSPNGGWLKAFPLRSFLELGAYDYSPGTARGHVANVLEDWRLHMLADPVHLVLSELLTNAVAATSAVSWEAAVPPVRLWVLGGPGSAGHGEVMLLIWDAIAKLPPEPGLADPLAESGRGLMLAKAYSTRLDFYLPPAPPGGKVARALIDRPAPPEDHLVTFRPGGHPACGEQRRPG